MIREVLRAVPRGLAFATLLLLGSQAFADTASPKFYVVVRGVDEGPGVNSGLVAEAKALFTTELGRRPELTLTAPSELGPGGASLASSTVPADNEAFKTALRQHKLRAIELTLRILEVTRTLDPPPAGKVLRVLKRGIKLAVFGTTLPDKVMAIGGDGESAIAAEIRRTDDVDREGKALLSEAAKVAITQAIDMTVVKLMLPPPKDKKATRKPKKK